MRSNLQVLTIGYAKRALDLDSRECQRMQRYASALGQLDMIIFTLRSDGYSDPVTIGNLTVHPTNTRTRLGALCKAVVIGKRLLKKQSGKTRIVSSQDPFATSLVARAIVFGTKVMHQVQVHGDVLNPLVAKRSLRTRLETMYARYVLKKADCIRVVSKRIKRSLCSIGVPEQRIAVVPIQASVADFLAVGERRVYEANTPTQLLYVGRLAPEKNLPLLIQAVASAHASGCQVALTLVGDGPERARIEALVTELGLTEVITFKTWTNAVTDVMAAADVLVLSSDHEGWGMVLVEAMAAGLPIITTDVGCAGEMVCDGRHGRVVPVADERAFADAIMQLTTQFERRAEYGRAAHRAICAWALPEQEYIEKWLSAFTCRH